MAQAYEGQGADRPAANTPTRTSTVAGETLVTQPEESSARLLVLVRHSLPAIEPDVPSARWSLSSEGRERCVALAAQLAACNLDAIVTSTEPKASETGQIVASILGIPCSSAPNLHEHERPSVPFGTTERFIEQVTRLFENPAELVMGNETAEQAHARYAAAVSDVVAQRPTGNLAIVSHGTVMTLFVSRLVNLDPVPFWRRLGLPAYAVFSLPDLDLLQVCDTIVSCANRDSPFPCPAHQNHV